MKMYKIFKDVSYKLFQEGENFEIKGIEYDSRKIEKDFVFVAMTGSTVDGHDFIQKAIDSGAKMIVCEKDVNVKEYRNADSVTFVQVEDIRKKLGIIASNYYDYPQNKIKIVGITGTNGKTTSSFILENILEKTARIGTTGNRILDEEFETVNTTPESLELIKLIDKSVKKGADYFIMEVSSHALQIGRVDMLQFDSAIFTNLTQDHLDFHATMAEYFDAKALFFRPGSPTRAARAGGCVDDEWGEKMASVFGSGVRTLATRGQAGDYTVSAVQTVERGGQEFRLAAPSGAVVAATVPLPGRFNVANAALALALADTVGVDMTALLPGLAGVGVPGRMEVVDCGQDFLAVVDYAHKPAAIKAVLATVRGQVTGRIGLVVGAGGDRDHSKRPIMGAEAAAGADYVVVTDDNPRNEDPAAIRAQVLAGTAAGSAEVVEIGDRRAAIRQVVAWAKPGDAVIIAGKGHEVGQLIDGVTHHFDDREELRAALEGRDQ